MLLEETVSPQHQNVPRHWSGVPGQRLSVGFPTWNPQPGTLPRPLSHLAGASRQAPTTDARPRPQRGQENLRSEIFPDVSSDRSHCFQSANGSVWSPIFRQIRGRKLVCSCDLSLCDCRKEPLSPDYLPPHHRGLFLGAQGWEEGADPLSSPTAETPPAGGARDCPPAPMPCLEVAPLGLGRPRAPGQGSGRCGEGAYLLSRSQGWCRFHPSPGAVGRLWARRGVSESGRRVGCGTGEVRLLGPAGPGLRPPPAPGGSPTWGPPQVAQGGGLREGEPHAGLNASVTPEPLPRTHPLPPLTPPGPPGPQD